MVSMLLSSPNSFMSGPASSMLAPMPLKTKSGVSVAAPGRMPTRSSCSPMVTVPMCMPEVASRYTFCRCSVAWPAVLLLLRTLRALAGAFLVLGCIAVLWCMLAVNATIQFSLLLTRFKYIFARGGDALRLCACGCRASWARAFLSPERWYIQFIQCGHQLPSTFSALSDQVSGLAAAAFCEKK